ncbi:hypothetical protein ACI2KR_31125 [Pseudomonas luteola]
MMEYQEGVYDFKTGGMRPILTSIDLVANFLARDVDVPKQVVITADAPNTYRGKVFTARFNDTDHPLHGVVVPVEGFPPLEYSIRAEKTHTLIIDDIDAILFVETNKQSIAGEGATRVYIESLAFLKDGAEFDTLKQARREIEARFRKALSSLDLLARKASEMGFAQEPRCRIEPVDGTNGSIAVYAEGKTQKLSSTEMKTLLMWHIRGVLLDSVKGN